ncbi:MAG: glycosyltransferase, partial [Candidatus Eisenbacteria bacterium]|nr:glycosyltransferase [Candidatus Eisenbacteria bacterium]
VYGELHRYVPVLAYWEGFRIGEEAVRHHPRKHGVSKFGYSRFLNGFLDLLSVMFLRKSERSPLHLFGRIGIFFFLIGLLINLYFGIEWLRGEPLRVRPLLLFGVGLIILAIQFISLGLLGEMIARLGVKRAYPSRKVKE